MSETHKQKTIGGILYRYCGNYSDPSKVKPHLRTMLSYEQYERGQQGLNEAVEHERAWLKDALLLDPEPTDTYTVADLKAMRLVSVWKPEARLPTPVTGESGHGRLNARTGEST